ncbi:MAG: hypothetical protein ACOX9R_05485 [Armatimonadota bacterium]|jgi:hypothetical protein
MPEFPQAFRDARFDDSLIACIKHTAATGIPLLALGQTVFWDELLKSMIVAAAQKHAPDLRLVAGAHDTDYFSKLPDSAPGDGETRINGFSLQPRDDHRTSQMWAAVAETSAVLGTEYPVTRAELRSAGLPLRQLAREHPESPAQFYREATMAWGWRGVANHSADRAVACDIPAAQVSPTVRALMDWAVEQSRDVLLDDGSRRTAERLLEVVEGLIEQCRSQTGERTLTDLYLCLLGGFYSVLLGELPEQVRIAASTEIFLFTCDTADRPRFDIVDIFLDPATRDVAREAYDTVVAHSGIYRLEQFGEGAIPFDVVICGRGRGTIRVLGDRAIFGMPEGPIEAETSGEIVDRKGLLAAAVRAFGCDARVVGKAIALPLMLSREFSMVLLENASVYVPQTHRLIRLLRRAGVEFELNPVVRLHLETWDAMGVADARLQMPEHLARFFEEDCMEAECFSRRWRGAVARARAMTVRLGDAHAPEEMLGVLRDAGGDVSELAAEYEAVARARRDSGEEIEALRERTRALWLEIKRLLRAADSAHQAPPRERLEQLRSEREELLDRIRRLAGSDEHQRLQRRYHELVLALQRRRLGMLADAHRTVGLEHSNYRPPWWWFLAVDPSGSWLTELAETATMRFEPFGMKV